MPWSTWPITTTTGGLVVSSSSCLSSAMFEAFTDEAVPSSGAMLVRMPKAVVTSVATW